MSEFKIDEIGNGRMRIEMDRKDFEVMFSAICEFNGAFGVLRDAGPPGMSKFIYEVKSLHNRLYRYILLKTQSKN